MKRRSHKPITTSPAGKQDSFITSPKKNLMGETVKVEPLRFEFSRKKDSPPHLFIFRGKNFQAAVSPNGWTGFGSLYHEPGDPILNSLNSLQGLSLGDMKLILAAWEKLLAMTPTD